MRRTVGELLDTCSYSELLEWGEYYPLDPFGEWRDDVRAAHIVSVIANVNRDPKKKPDPFTIEDFMIKFGQPKVVNAVAEGAAVSPGVIAWLFSQGKSKRVH